MLKKLTDIKKEPNGSENKPAPDDHLFEGVKKNKNALEEKFKKSADFVAYEFETQWGLQGLVCYISEVIKRDELDRDILHPFITAHIDIENTEISYDGIKRLLPVSNIAKSDTVDKTIDYILGGNIAFFAEGVKSAFIIPFNGWQKRSIEEPPSESVVQGPKEGFIESLNLNRTLLRKRIKNENLVFEEMEMGKQTKTKVNIAYLDNIVNPDVLTEVRSRLSKINIDSMLDSGYIEQYIEDSHISPVSTVGSTQKPDVAAAKILEGRVAILCDGSPHVLTVPHLFIETLQTSEDYYVRPYIATFLRIVRILALLLTTLLPSFYVSLETFHQEMLPTTFLITMVGANKGTPFPAFWEALLMIIAFEFLKESGTRLPKAIGSAISIVGALIVGDAAVKAGLVSTDLIVVVAFTAVSSFIIPAQNEEITLYRLFLLILSATMGLYGITCGVFFIILHNTSLRSFGVPYMSPLAPGSRSGMKDFIPRFPLRSMKKRPELIASKNMTRRS